LEPTKFAVIGSIAAPNGKVGHPEGAIIGYVFEHGDNLDVALFARRLQGITSKSIEKSKSRLLESCSCCPIWDPVCEEILDLERG